METLRGPEARAFAQIFQDEWLALAQLGVRAMGLSVYASLIVRRDARDHWCHDSEESLARHAGMGLTSLKTQLAILERLGVIESGPLLRRRGGPRGAAYAPRARRALPLDEWRGRADALREERPSPDQSSWEERSSRLGRAAARDALSGRHPTGTKSVSRYLSREPRTPSADASLTDAERDARARVSELWARRDQLGLRFGDDLALGWLDRAVLDAFEAGCTPADVAAGVDTHASVPFADPREGTKWALEARDERLHAEEGLREATRRRERRQEYDEASLREHSDPAVVAAKRQLVAQGLAHLRGAM